jgi:hypothetical protein
MAGTCSTLDSTPSRHPGGGDEGSDRGPGLLHRHHHHVAGRGARTTARSFSIETDEPAPLGGTDVAIDPMELVLAAIGTCLTIGWVTHAASATSTTAACASTSRATTTCGGT